MIITNTQNNSFTQSVSTIRGTSDSWNSNYTSFNTQSAANASVYTSFNTQSAANASTYTTLNANSASWVVDGGNSRAANISIGSNDAYNLNLKTNNTSRLTILSNNGNVGIGNSLPGEKLTVTGNISALSGIHHIGNPPGVIPVFLTVSNINLVAATGTRTAVYNVPAGMIFTASAIKVIITSSNQTSNFTTGPNIGITRNDGSKLFNDIVLSNSATYGAYIVGDVASSAGNIGTSNAHRTYSTDTVGISIVTPAYSGGTFSGVPNLVATAIIIGELVYL